ncbi:MAG: tRNA lysidine(34) synthetase TilS [Maricaulaceae bacterium]
MDKQLNLEDIVEGALTRLLPSRVTPFAVAFSGGGDSVALVHALRAHAARAHVFIVDHGLRQGSQPEALAAQRQAQSWGFKCDVLTWSPEAVTTAIQEKARLARYGLMGERLRSLGLRYLLTGHTLGDQAETCLMRYDRDTGWRGAAGMRERVYAPIWPALAGIELIRPLLKCSREKLRAYNRKHGLDWADDPSNQNADFTRIRARQYLSTKADLSKLLVTTADDLQAGLLQEQQQLEGWTKTHADVSGHGFIRFKSIPNQQVLRRFIQAVGGRGKMTDAYALEKLQAQMRGPSFKAATLNGCQITAHKTGYLLVCEASRAKGRKGHIPASKPQEFSSGHHVWDQRFLISYTGKDVVKIGHAFGHISRLADCMRSFPPEARLTLPLIENTQGDVIGVGAYHSDDLSVEWLGHERLMGRVSV